MVVEHSIGKYSAFPFHAYDTSTSHTYLPGVSYTSHPSHLILSPHSFHRLTETFFPLVATGTSVTDSLAAAAAKSFAMLMM